MSFQSSKEKKSLPVPTDSNIIIFHSGDEEEGENFQNKFNIIILNA